MHTGTPLGKPDVGALLDEATAGAVIDGGGLASHTLAAVIDGLRLREAVGLGMTALASRSDVG
ncbi:hypothetical protein [Halomonas sp. H10-9-1]|uniref:hypothetical protein n=1 Tax=Halomonas sp. H10-9-1 TaxID=2950871 RepID=UPI0032DEBB48